MQENPFLAWIESQTPPHPQVPLNIGDDMAAVIVPPASAGGPAMALLKIDQCLDQVHFDLAKHSAQQAATKAVNRCLSDCAAMACRPAAIMLAVTLPRDGSASTDDFARQLFLAAQAAAMKFDCPLVGGDTAVWPRDGQLLAMTVAALGTLEPGQSPVTRSGAKAGDTLFVSGALGGSILGRHLDFTPRIELAQQLAKTLGKNLHAMMDLSDGLAQDLPRLCAASHVGAQVHAAQLPIHEDAYRLAEIDKVPAGMHALADGEDYELLFTVDPETVPELIPISQKFVPLTAIGTITADQSLRLLAAPNRVLPWPSVGWQHGG